MLCRGETRENSRDAIRDGLHGNSTVFVINVATVDAKSEIATAFITRTMRQNGWKKSGDTQRFHSLRGVYVKEFENPPTGNVLKFATEDYTKVRNLIQEGIQEFVKNAEQPAKVHTMLTQGVLYDEERIEMLEFPYADADPM